MSQVSIWFERKFEFSFPVELYPNLLARLRGTPARLDEIFHGRSAKLLTRKPDEKWSAQEHAGHLLDLESLWLARVGDYVAGSEELAAADLLNGTTRFRRTRCQTQLRRAGPYTRTERGELIAMSGRH